MRKLGKVVCNSSPIIGLSILGLLHLLWDIFDEVYVTQAVYDEIVRKGKTSWGAEELKFAVNEEKIEVYYVIDEFFVRKFYGKLHKGELETIAAAKELNCNYLLLYDKAARNLANALLLEPMGLIGFLKLSKLIGKVESLRKCLDELIKYNFRISKKLYMQLLKEVGEI